RLTYSGFNVLQAVEVGGPLSQGDPFAARVKRRAGGVVDRLEDVEAAVRQAAKGVAPAGDRHVGVARAEVVSGDADRSACRGARGGIRDCAAAEAERVCDRIGR